MAIIRKLIKTMQLYLTLCVVFRLDYFVYLQTRFLSYFFFYESCSKDSVHENKIPPAQPKPLSSTTATFKTVAKTIPISQLFISLLLLLIFANNHITHYYNFSSLLKHSCIFNIIPKHSLANYVSKYHILIHHCLIQKLDTKE